MFDFIRQSYRMAGRHKKRLAAGTAMVVLQNFALLITFVAIYFGFAALGAPGGAPVTRLLLVTALGFLFHFFSGWLQNKLIAGVFFHIYRDYRLEVGERLKRAPMGYFSEQSLSKILAALTNVLRALENYSQMCFNFTTSGLSVCFFLLLGMYGMHPLVGLVVSVLLIPVWLCVALLFRLSKREVAAEHGAVADFVDGLVEGVRGTQVLRSFPAAPAQAVESVHARVRRSSDKVRAAQVHFERVFVGTTRFFAALLHLSSLCVVLLSAYLYQRGALALPQTLTLSVAGFMLFHGLLPLQNAAVLAAKNPAHLAYLREILDIPEQSAGACAEAPARRDLVFEDVSFGYRGDREVIRHFSCTIPEGSRTAIVGPSGAGKSTLINLIARFYDPGAGRITLGGRDLRDYDMAALLGELSLVFQDVYLFNDTVRNNIRFAKPEASDAEVVRAAKRARCHDFIAELPEGYETPVGEGGARFSGGEKQRISIARALLKDAPIILLDEATSSVDPENEGEILSALRELTGGKTVISIAHRLSTVREADQILVLKEGELEQAGRHEALLSAPGTYRDFYRARQRAVDWSLTGGA